MGLGGPAQARAGGGGDGFTLVQSKNRSGGTKEITAAESSGPAATGSPAQAQAQPQGASPASPAQKAAAANGDGEGGGQPADDGGAEREDAGEERTPTADDLREVHAREQQLVEFLIQQGYAQEHPVRMAAEAQAAEAKRAWLEAKPGAAVTQRMLWAEQALKRARRNQAKMEQTIDDLDNEYQHTRLIRTQQLAELRARTKEREAKLAEVSRQAAVEFRSAGDEPEGGPLRDAADTLEEQVTPAIKDILDQIPEGSPMRGTFEDAICLKGVQGSVATASRERWADT